MYWKVQIEPVCATESREQLGKYFVFNDPRYCKYIVTVFIDCKYPDATLYGLTQLNEDGEEVPVPFVYKRQHINALFIFFDLQMNRFVFGTAAIIMGLMMTFINYHTNNKKCRYALIYTTCVIVSYILFVLPIYVTAYKENFSLSAGWEWLGFSLILALVLFFFSIKIGIRMFTLLSGMLTGFCICNTLNIAIVYKLHTSRVYYLDYIVFIILFTVLAQVFNTNIYNYMFSFNGAFFMVRGFVILWDNSQIG